VPWRVGKDDLAARQTAQRMDDRALEDNQALEVGKLVCLAEEMVGIGAVMADQAEQRCSVANPIILTDGGCFKLATPRWRSMYSVIERLMWGKMCGEAWCSVLSRSKSQTFPEQRISVT